MPYSPPNKARNYQRDYRRLRRAGDCTTPCTTQVPMVFRLKTAADVLRLVEEQVDAVRSDADSGPLDKARCIGFLGGVALRAIETGNLAARLEAMEAAMKRRKGSNGKP